MNILKITPKTDCKACQGTGEVVDYVPWGATETAMETLCDCVLEQIPEDKEDWEVEITFEQE